MNYYVYTDNSGRQWSMRLDAVTATFTGAIHALTPLPRVPDRVEKRRLRLAEAVTGKETLVNAPYAWPAPLGELLVYNGDIWYVVAQLEETYKFEAP